MGYGAHGYDSRTNARAWLAVDNKYRTRGRNGGYFGYGNENTDGLNELSRGTAEPRPVTSTAISSSISSGNNGTASRNQTYHPNSQYMGLNHPRPMPAMGANPGFMSRIYPNKLYGQYGNAVRSGMGYGAHGYDSRTNARAWLAVDNKYRTRGRNGGYFGYGNENTDGLNELSRGTAKVRA
ncbi:hypothetical protein RYX36_021782 [Vicia faba]